MCYSLNASIGSLVAGWTGCYLLWRSGLAINKVFGLFMAYVISMQLLEAVMWSDQDCTGMNQLASKIALVQNVGQPIMAFILFYAFTPKRWQMVSSVAVTIYIVTLLHYFWSNREAMTKPSYWCTRSRGEGLVWNWVNDNTQWMWSVFVVSAFLILFLSRINKLTTIAMFSALMMSAAMYKDVKTYGSWWCFYAVSIPFLQLFLTRKLI